jgi:hypothetical protein
MRKIMSFAGAVCAVLAVLVFIGFAGASFVIAVDDFDAGVMAMLSVFLSGSMAVMAHLFLTWGE